MARPSKIVTSCDWCGALLLRKPSKRALHAFCSSKEYGLWRTQQADETFWDHITIVGDCWIWTGARARKEYGTTSRRSRAIPAHNQDAVQKGRNRVLVGDECPWVKLSEADVQRIFALRGTMLHKEIAQQFGVSRSYITQILRGTRRLAGLGAVQSEEVQP